MSKIRIKNGLVVTKADNTVTITKNDPIRKTVSVEILNAITGATLPANLTHAEFTEKYLTDSAAPSKSTEPIEKAIQKIKMADGSIHSVEDAENDSVDIQHLETGRKQTVTQEYFKHLVDDKHVTFL